MLLKCLIDSILYFLFRNIPYQNSFLCVGVETGDYSKIFNFEIVYFPFRDGDAPRSPSYGVYISQLIGAARVCSYVAGINTRNTVLTSKFLKQGY